AVRGRIEYLWKGQGGRSPVCGQLLRIEEQPRHLHHRVWRCQSGQGTFDNLELLHANCHRRSTRGRATDGTSRVLRGRWLPVGAATQKGQNLLETVVPALAAGLSRSGRGCCPCP